MTSKRGFSRKALDERIQRDPEFAKDYREASNEDLGEALKMARLRAGLSQKQVAQRMGVSDARVTQLESKTGNSITLRSLRRYATAVGCRLDVSLVNPTDSSVISQLFVLDDRSPDPIQIEASERNIARALSTAICTHFTSLPPRAASSTIDSLLHATEAIRKVHSVQLKTTVQEAWVPRPTQESYAVAGV